MLLQESQGRSSKLSKNRCRINIPIVAWEYERIYFNVTRVSLYWINFDIKQVCLVRFVLIKLQLVLLRFTLSFRLHTYFYRKS